MLLVLAFACVLIPSLTVSSIASLVFFVGSTAAASAILFANRATVPRTVKVAHFGVLLVLVGVLTDAGTTIATG